MVPETDESPEELADRARLTKRERDIARMASAGLKNSEIAEILGISLNAVRFHLKEVHGKVESGSQRAELRSMSWLRRLAIMPAAVGAKLTANVVAAAGLIGLAGALGYGAWVAYPGNASGRSETGTYCMQALQPTPHPAALGVTPAPTSAAKCFTSQGDLNAYQQSLVGNAARSSTTPAVR